MASRSGPTIVLIGGSATLDSGAVVDSRQPLAGDKWDFVLRDALGTSEAWWSFAKALADVIVSQHPTSDAWALAWVGKTIKRPRGDKGFTRVRSMTFLDHADDLIDVGGSEGSPYLRIDRASSRYRLLPYMLRFDDLQGGSPPVAIVGGCHTTYADGTDIVGDRPLDYFAYRWPDAVVILPHTPITEAKARRVGRRAASRKVRINGLAEQTHPAKSRDFVAGMKESEDLRRAHPFVVSHDFHVTFWADQGAIRDPADLDAALTFVKSRFDLNVGLWDLARNPALRKALLAPAGIAAPVATPAAIPK